MAFPQVSKLFFFVTLLALVSAQFASSTDHVFKGSVTCLDCDLMHHNDLSEIKVLVKCSNVKKIVMAITEKDGTFETDLPQDNYTNNDNNNDKNCLAKIVGGSSLIYTLGKKTISRVVKIEAQKDYYYYTNEEPLNFYKSCPKQEDDNQLCASSSVAASKTVDIPLPREWGLAPSSYYVPFIPIIGIP